jgi:hypothetical protein
MSRPGLDLTVESLVFCQKTLDYSTLSANEGLKEMEFR